MLYDDGHFIETPEAIYAEARAAFKAGDQAAGLELQELARDVDTALGVVMLASFLTGKGYSHARRLQMFPAGHENRKMRRMFGSKRYFTKMTNDKRTRLMFEAKKNYARRITTKARAITAARAAERSAGTQDSLPGRPEGE